LGVVTGERIEYPDNTFDAVLALDVLEHLENENWALKELNRVLKPGGVAIVMVPAFMFLWGVQDEVSQHFRRYDQKMLKSAIVKSASWNIVRISYFNFFLFFPIALVRVGSRLLGLKSRRQSDFDINGKLMNNLFYLIFNTERKILKLLNYPFGVSILTVLKKNKA
jgi:SAM-dependent methyltransferase